ncbi:hypothetical protein [Sphingobacterium hungaricum]|uniref:hypothetical protein n=1 Tax=Sphingobacterium hungaricum TaxID=2082723 RepID=UPI0018C92DEC|nr:hypothetical protein [Sphingobacterium hungaricum]
MRRYTYIAILLLLTTWLMTGFAVDDEFSDEFRFFVKHRPFVTYYFKSPLGMQDMPTDYPSNKMAEYSSYREFVLDKHWSSDIEWVAEILLLLTVISIGYVFVQWARTNKIDADGPK